MEAQRKNSIRRLLTAAGEQDPRPSGLNRAVGVLFTVFLFLTITYLVLNSVWECLRRWIQPDERTRRGHPGREAERMAQLQAIPVVIYGQGNGNGSEEKETCAVCLGEYLDEEEVRVLPQCKHLFHRACIDEWLLERSSFCPVCRARVIQFRLEFEKNNGSTQSNGNSDGGVHRIERGLRIDRSE
ncbi:hypothetical protein J5N97_029313 [Dioscorea zingiberensis]|uniref:RING-type domain-containing protein n=1 Tax=Dioscorea zingiberensis TaxID=325984 RepID=A0A9D5C026_9LILI|nr:hypothetical protein J5N97_029313 [Dioscorea zingiberensis]